VIERLVTGLRELAAGPVQQLRGSAGARLRGDCADAVRLELDCPQQALTAAQRAALSRLSDVLEGDSAPAEEVFGAARHACAVLGLHAPT
jgi:hypothetical protein